MRNYVNHFVLFWCCRLKVLLKMIENFCNMTDDEFVILFLLFFGHMVGDEANELSTPPHVHVLEGSMKQSQHNWRLREPFIINFIPNFGGSNLI